MEQIKPKDLWTMTLPPGSSPTTLVKSDLRTIKVGSTFCKVPKDSQVQLKCNYFLYDSDQKYCTFYRFNGLGMCDYTPEGYDNVVQYNAEARKRKGK